MSKRDLNCFSASGRVGKEPELRNTKSGKSVCDVSVAINVGFGESRYTVWTRLTIWGKQAEFIGQNAHKGDLIVFTGAEYRIEEFAARDGTTKKTHYFEVGQNGQVNVYSTGNSGRDEGDHDNDDNAGTTDTNAGSSDDSGGEFL